MENNFVTEKEKHEIIGFRCDVCGKEVFGEYVEVPSNSGLRRLCATCKLIEEAKKGQ